ncbi:MAG: SDR family oxidoreductase [Chloroflexi bacterium]|nr:SDR family oxidoreductase [Chloroflexota bacterium]
MRILLTGGAGYVGSRLVPELIGRGHHVRVLDSGDGGLEHARPFRGRIELVRDDVRRLGADRRFAAEMLDDRETVIHLAAISNDPSADVNPELTWSLNVDATVQLARLSRARRQRFVFASSCSVYGEAAGEQDEDGALAPLTTYAASKAAAERALLDLADDAWRPTILRNGTLFGYSPRMRFDLVANIFALQGTRTGEINIFGDGLQWRPLLHVRDCAQAFVHVAERPALRHAVYNIAHVNLRVIDLAATFRRLLPGLIVRHRAASDLDRRDYRVSTRRLRAEGFAACSSVEDGARELVEAIVSGRIRDLEPILQRDAPALEVGTQSAALSPRAGAGQADAITSARMPAWA